MPPIYKGRKRGAASAKSGSNGIELKSKSNGIEEEFSVVTEVAAVAEKAEVTKSGRGRKKANVAENKEELEDKPVLGEERLGKEVIKDLEKANGDNAPEEIDEVPDLEAPEKNESTKGEPQVTEDGVGNTDSEVQPEKVPAGKRGRKKIVPLPVVDEDEAKEAESTVGRRGRKKAVPEADEVAATEAKEPEKAFGKRGRKKAAVAEVVEDEVADMETTEEPEKTLGKRGRKKAVVIELDEEEAKEEPEKPLGKRGRKKDEAKEEPEKVPFGKRGRKKAGVVEIDISEEETEKVAGRRNRKTSRDEEMEEELAPPAKRGASRKDKVVDQDEEDDTEDFVPRKTRGGRNAKEVVAPVPKGRKKKVANEKAAVKQSKKGKAVDEIPEEESSAMMDESKQVKVIIKRDHDVDEMARNLSLEEEKDTEVAEDKDTNVKEEKDTKVEKEKDTKVEEEKDTKVKSVKGPAKSGRKRANDDAGETKPEKVQKVEPSKAKSGSKKPQIPDVSVLDFGNTSKTPGGEPWNFKIASWNVNGVRAWLEKNGLSYLHHEKPDVLCVQETKCSDDKLPEDLTVEGYHGHWLAGDKDGYSGVGILSKEKPLAITEGIGLEEHDSEGRVITAEYEKFYLVTTYVPNSGRGLVRLDYRKKWDEDFRAYLKTLDEKKPVVLCGDLNVCHEEIDIANPKGNKKSAGFTQEERDGFSSLLKEGFVDTFRQLYPDAKDAYTFWTYMMNARAKNVGWRLDYFVISERFKDHLCDSLIRKEVFGSDHCPVALLLHL